MGAQWLSGRALDSRPKGLGFESHRRHCVVSLSKNINPSLVPVQPRKTRPFITERLLMGHKESNQTKYRRPNGFVWFSLKYYKPFLVRSRHIETGLVNSEPRFCFLNTSSSNKSMDVDECLDNNLDL